MATFTAEKFPRFEPQIRQFAAGHKEFREEPLQLAVVFEPDRDHDDIFLFEVAENFGYNEVDPNKEFMETVFNSQEILPGDTNTKLHLILTNPRELRTAIDENWTMVQEIKSAVRGNRYEVLHSTVGGEELLEALRS